ncbi:hypothetical protein Sste5346_002277 [Sporothrix stenoceras]|uniref:Uncharacterized protein n=1 Tax=Sporothrix stenoceras TaxID=5173 RepID=A0ABR3ZK78_9PEZI
MEQPPSATSIPSSTSSGGTASSDSDESSDQISSDSKENLKRQSRASSEEPDYSSDRDSSSGRSSSAATNVQLPPSPSANSGSVPLVTPLTNLDSFDSWDATLMANLRYHGLAGFLASDGDGADDERRKLAKGIIWCSAEEILSALKQANKKKKKKKLGALASSRKRKRASAGENVTESQTEGGRESTTPSSSMTTTGTAGSPIGGVGALETPYNYKIKTPRHHYNAAVAYMARRAALTGHTAMLVQQLCTADRSACDSLAAYQHLLTDTRRRLSRLGADPGDDFAVWVALSGLKTAHSRWHAKLVAQRAAGQLDWEELMAAMAGRACKE